MMTAPVMWVALAMSTLIAVGVFGPSLIRHAGPVLARTPRLSALCLSASIFIIPSSFLTLIMSLAWALTGPSIFPLRASQVCQQCLDAANPFAAAAIRTAIPSVIFIAVPLAFGAVGVISAAAHYYQRQQNVRRTAQEVLGAGQTQNIQGHDVVVVSDPRPWAVAFSPHHGGIAISSGALSTLADDELAAVLAHEKAHILQRHHALTDIISSFTTPLRWVPFIRAAAIAVEEYLEIAADQRACQQVSTPALVRALLVLGEKTSPTDSAAATSGALFAAGTARISNLVVPHTGHRGYLSTAVTLSLVLIFAAISGYILLSHTTALATGCVL